MDVRCVRPKKLNLKSSKIEQIDHSIGQDFYAFPHPLIQLRWSLCMYYVGNLLILLPTYILQL